MPPGQAELAGRNVVHLDVRFLGAESRCVEEARRSGVRAIRHCPAP
ncbi:hypothetical protein [Streptomyces sp. DH10]|nr:hypothetical protein [Streptomyces sp. DH10]MDG9710617.1 hypothetical protein [Streptomyces sp. DH10]